MRRVCVFCGSRSGNRPAYAAAAQRLGELLAGRGIGLVYGGGSIGLMGVVARAALSAGGEVVGVIPARLAEREVLLSGITETHVVESMHQRKALMADRSDGFLALPGGYGTCDELFEILTWAQLGIHTKPVAIVNVEGFFTPALAMLDHMIAEGFLREKYRTLVLVCQTPEEALLRMADYRPFAPPERILDELQR